MRFSLRTKILLLIAGTVAGLAVLISTAMMTLANQETDRKVHADVKATGGVLAQFMRERSQSLEQQSRLLVRSSTFKQYFLKPDWATFTDFAEDFRQQLRAESAVMTDRDGRVLGETGGAMTFHADRSHEPGIAQALDGEAWKGVVMRGNQMALAVSVPVKIGEEVWGTFTAYSALNGEVARNLTGVLSGSEIAFVHRGRVVGASIALPTQLPTPQKETKLATLAGTPYFLLYAPLPDTDAHAEMGFAVLLPFRAVMAMYERSRMACAAVSAVTLLLALAMGALVARGITRPLDGVVDAAHTLQSGQWPERFDVRRRDEIGLLQSVFNEMTVSLRSSQERLLALIDTDPLTGLDNHRRFQERLSQETKRCKASGEALSLLMFDLDHFQQYNQQQGHTAGDEALKTMAFLLQNCLPDVAILARYGGQQFVALLPQHRLEEAEQFGETLRALVETQGRSDDGKVNLTVSVGCAELGLHTSRADGLALAADLAVTRAKQTGRNQVCRFDSLPESDGTQDPYELLQSLKDGSLSTMQALAAAVDAKDPYTQGHSLRVAQYASELARSIGRPQSEVDLIYMTGTLHDVGKIGVPDAILQKPERLTDEERAVMETHPVLGEVIIRKAPQLAATLPGVRHHHERWDGRGYPDRLQGEAIPSMARILAVADTFDAMTSDRPYRKGLALEIALAEIEKGAGTQFQPELARAFVEMKRAEAQKQEKAA